MAVRPSPVPTSSQESQIELQGRTHPAFNPRSCDRPLRPRGLQNHLFDRGGTRRGLSPSAIYPYFANKEALFIAAVDEDAAGEIEDGMAGVRDDDLIGDWRHVIVGFLDALDRHPLARRVLAGLEPEFTVRLIGIPGARPTSKGSGREPAEPSDERRGTRRSRRVGDGERVLDDLAVASHVARPDRFATGRPAGRGGGRGVRCGDASRGAPAFLTVLGAAATRGGRYDACTAERVDVHDPQFLVPGPRVERLGALWSEPSLYEGSHRCERRLGVCAVHLVEMQEAGIAVGRRSRTA